MTTYTITQSSLTCTDAAHGADKHAFEIHSGNDKIFTLMLSYDAAGRQNIELQSCPWSGEYLGETVAHLKIAIQAIEVLEMLCTEDDELPLTSTIERLQKVKFEM